MLHDTMNKHGVLIIQNLSMVCMSPDYTNFSLIGKGKDSSGVGLQVPCIWTNVLIEKNMVYAA